MCNMFILFDPLPCNNCDDYLIQNKHLTCKALQSEEGKH